MPPAATLPTPPPASNGNGTSHPAKSSAQTTIKSPTSASSDSQVPAWVQPDLTRLLHVEHNPGSFTSRSVSLVTLPPHAIFARINSPTPATCAYSSVQAGPDLHIELNCDLVYINHSCKPSLVFDMEKWEVRVGEEGLKEGDELTFFYPSTEWSMAQPFDCFCKTGECKGKITGAKDMPVSVLRKYWLNRHIEAMLAEKDSLGGR